MYSCLLLTPFVPKVEIGNNSVTMLTLGSWVRIPTGSLLLNPNILNDEARILFTHLMMYHYDLGYLMSIDYIIHYLRAIMQA